MKVVSLSALSTGHLHAPEEMVRPQGHSAAWRRISWKISDDIIGYRTRNASINCATACPLRNLYFTLCTLWKIHKVAWYLSLTGKIKSDFCFTIDGIHERLVVFRKYSCRWEESAKGYFKWKICLFERIQVVRLRFHVWDLEITGRELQKNSSLVMPKPIASLGLHNFYLFLLLQKHLTDQQLVANAEMNRTVTP